ncbi:MAG: ATP-binding protein [Xanthomonadales bacterium]|nr:ATP-binding protein [Xanthomonadales bacterium]
MKRTAPTELKADQLHIACELDGMDFEFTDSLIETGERFGQQRAVEAIRFGIEVDGPGYNLFVLGPHGSNRHGLVRDHVVEKAEQQPPPADWCYVNNFRDPQKPRALSLPSGKGREFRDDMAALIEDLKLAIPAAFEGDDYRNQLKAIEKEVQQKLTARWKAFELEAAEEDVAVMQTSTGWVLVPVRDQHVLSEEEAGDLPEEEQKKIGDSIARLSKRLREHLEHVPQLRKAHREQIKKLDRDVMTQAVGVLLRELKDRYVDLPHIVAWLEEVEQQIVENAGDFREQEPSPLPFVDQSKPSFSSYEVNLLVDGEPDNGCPVIYEPNPSYTNVLGCMEHQAQFGALVTDFRMIRSGALHRANGGYLILDMWRVLSRPFVWDALKQALFSSSLRIENPGEAYGLISTASLQPEPIPLKAKIILIGERWLYYLLCFYDSEFHELFRVTVDLEDDLPRTRDNTEACAYLIADLIRMEKLQPFSRNAVRAVIEQRARAVSDSERLSTHMRSLQDLLIQADYWARSRGAETVHREDVKTALDQIHDRLERIRRRLLEAVERDVLLIDTRGEQVGQINGLSVLSLGEYRFGHPMRITATSRIGSGEVVDIEREVKLGGKIHSKGMMILSSALAARYASDMPLSLHASVVFEQSYGGVDGDSASVAELCVLLSSLSDVPIRQNLAVTGSINQLGRVQVIGGINEKVEGFFEVCRRRGLDGSHGVVMPAENVQHLMLREEVVEAVKAGQFHIYPVSTIDEALSVLTGQSAGERDEQGAFPEDSVNGRVERQLRVYAELRQDFGRSSREGEGSD